MSNEYYVTLACLALSTVVILWYYLRYYLAVSSYKSTHEKDRRRPVSVIICAHNEKENLIENLPWFLNQKHDNYEVVVVNDGSWDGSQYVLKTMQGQYAHLQVVTIDKDMKKNAGKKMALTLGIKKAAYDRFVLSDADCRPKSEHWLAHMSACLDKDITLGYSPYKASGGFLNRLIRYDTFQVACLYLGKAIVNRAYMGVGRNMAYTREMYDQAGGFRSHYYLSAGDDDLFVNHNAQSGRVSICIDEESQVLSEPKKTFKSWFRQKRRHVGVSKAYKSDSKRWLAMFHFAHLLFYLSLAAAVVVTSTLKIALILFLAKTLIQLLISHFVGQNLRDKVSLVLVPIMEPLLMLINAAVAISLIISKPVRWK